MLQPRASFYFHCRLLTSPHNLPPAPRAGILPVPRKKRIGTMKREYHRWHSPRLGLDVGVVVYGHWGPPLVGFPTSAGDEWELEGQGMIAALSDFIEAGK